MQNFIKKTFQQFRTWKFS